VVSQLLTKSLTLERDLEGILRGLDLNQVAKVHQMWFRCCCADPLLGSAQAVPYNLSVGRLSSVRCIGCHWMDGVFVDQCRDLLVFS
jgi:hypothetical protein